MSTLKERS